MNVEEMAGNWNAWGNQDPMYAILTDPEKAHGQWNEEEFFASGEKQIEEKLKWIRNAGLTLHFGKALDFGCGIGRLSNALAKYFDEVHGVDISKSMIERARQLCRFPGKIKYYENTEANLGAFKTGTYDLVYTELVLQHIPQHYQLCYLADFFRLLSEPGIAYFQTVRTVGWRSLAPDWVVEWYRSRKHKGRAFIPMYGITSKAVRKVVSQSDCRLLSYTTTRPSDHARGFRCDLYVVAKKRA